MNPVTCPLAAKQPLADLTAESARNAVKTFEGLDYSPEEASTAAYVEEQITKHSRLGFTQCRISCYGKDLHLSGKLIKCLTSPERRFHVTVWWTAGVRPVHYLCSKPDFFTDVQEHTVVSWGEPVPAPEGTYATWGEAHEVATKLADKSKAAWEALNAEIEAKALKETEEAQRHAKQPAPTPPPSGCLPLLLALPTALYFLLS